MKKRKSITRNSIEYSQLNGITDTIIKAFTTGPLLTVYAVSLGMNNANIGLMQAILPFSNLLHLVVAKFLETGWSPRKIAWISSLIARPFLLVIAISVFFKNSTLGICFFVIPYILSNICAAFTSGANWPWLKEIIPQKLMTSFFARRIQYSTIAKMAVTLFATGVIYLVSSWQKELEIYCYSIFYVLAFIFGIVCTYTLYKIQDVKLKRVLDISFRQKIKIVFANRDFSFLFLGLGLANFVLMFYTTFNIVFLLKKIGLSVAVIMSFTLLSNIAEICFAQVWQKNAIKYKSTTLLMLTSVVYVISIMFFIFLTFVTVQNNLYLALILILIAILIGIGASGFFITTNAISLNYVPKEMSSVYLSLLNIGRFGANGLGTICSGFMLGLLANNNYQWLIFFLVCALLYILNGVISYKIKPVEHISYVDKL